MTDLITKAREGRMAALKSRAALGAPSGGTRLRLAAWSDVPALGTSHETVRNIFVV